MALLNKYHLAEVAGNVDKLGNIDFTNDDVIFGWTRIEVPRGGFCIKSIFATFPEGRNTSSGSYGSHPSETNTGRDFHLIFGKSVNGVAPPALPDSNSPMTVITGSAQRPYIIGSYYYDGATRSDTNVPFKSWAFGGIQSDGPSTDLVKPATNLILEGDPNYPGTTSGYQSIWVACLAASTGASFATQVLVDGAHTDTDDLTIDISENIDGDDIFAVGDEVIAFASDGSSEQVIGTVTAVAADVLTVDAVAGALADDDEICLRKPVKFFLGLEY
jgi:hypothetical protein|tara:strand:+ start:42 stop:863 length:822 start_codon:yes stop_codon:yes gene_type:complete